VQICKYADVLNRASAFLFLKYSLIQFRQLSNSNYL
jgi:hypothetical protein